METLRLPFGPSDFFRWRRRRRRRRKTGIKSASLQFACSSTAARLPCITGAPALVMLLLILLLAKRGDCWVPLLSPLYIPKETSKIGKGLLRPLSGPPATVQMMARDRQRSRMKTALAITSSSSTGGGSSSSGSGGSGSSSSPSITSSSSISSSISSSGVIHLDALEQSRNDIRCEPPLRQPGIAKRPEGKQKRRPPSQTQPIPDHQETEEEVALVKQLEQLRKKRRRQDFRAFLRRVDVDVLKRSTSLALLETFVRAAGACQEPEVAWDALQGLLTRVQDEQDSIWTPRWDTFSNVMNACRRRKDLDNLLRVFKAALPYRGFSKTVLLNILLAGLCDNGRMDVAAFYLETAESKWGLVPNEVSWNTLLGAAMRAGQSKLLEDLERKMEEQGVEGDVTTRNIRLQHLLANHPEEGIAFFARLKEQQVKYLQECANTFGASSSNDERMDLRTLNIMAGYLAKSRGFDEAQAMIDDVRKRGLGIQPRAVTHNIMLDSLFKAGRVDEALEYFYDIAAAAASTEAGSSGYPRSSAPSHELPLVDITTYDILLNGLVQNGRVSTAVVVYEMVQKTDLRPTIYTYAALVRLQKSATDVYRVWSLARANCTRLSLPFLNLLIYELGQNHSDLEGALCAFRTIVRTGLRPNTISYNSLLSAFMRDVDNIIPAPLSRGEEGKEEEDGNHYMAAGLSPEARKMLDLLDSLDGKSILEGALAVLRSMYAEDAIARCNARTFTILMAGISKAEGLGTRITALCVALYREAQAQGVQPNGILCHALLRAFGSDATGALAFFKNELRGRLKALDLANNEPKDYTLEASSAALTIDEGNEALIAGHLALAYMALLYDCGLARRPDLALQTLYAMQRDGIETNHRAWESYVSGKDSSSTSSSSPSASSSSSSLLMAPYESLLRSETLGWQGNSIFQRIRIKF